MLLRAVCLQPLIWEVDDENGIGKVVIERKTPRVLNDYSLAQPGVDRNNRYRQRLLQMEKRMLTMSFAFRFLTTMLGITFTNAFFYMRFTTSDKSIDFNDLMRELAIGLMHNDTLATERMETGQDTDSAISLRATSAYQSKSPRSRGRSAGIQGSPCKNTLVALRHLEGYSGAKQQRCIVCGEACSWACSICSTGSMIFSLHPCRIGAGRQMRRFNCLAAHRRAPEGHNPVCIRVKPAGGGGGKRQRKN